MTDQHQVEVSWSTEPLEEEPPEPEIRRWLNSALDQLVSEPVEVSVQVVGEDEMTSLNLEYRQKEGSTNVLSFPADLPGDIGHRFLGDVVVCNAVVQRESESFHKPLKERYAHMLIHGLLHLLGHDHLQEHERLKMEQSEVSLLASMGFSNPYELSHE